MQYHPVYLDLRGRPCVVIGGGEGAARKVESLLAAGARVTVVSPELTAALAALAETHEIMHHLRPYRHGDLAGAAVAYAATGDDAVHAEVAAEAAVAGVWLNVVDRAHLSSFIAPAVATRGPVSVAISTGGASPALARHLREKVEEAIGPEYGLAATILGKLRPLVQEAHAEQGARRAVFASLIASPLLADLRARDAHAVDALLEKHVGPGTTLATLGVTLDASAASDGAPSQPTATAQSCGGAEPTATAPPRATVPPAARPRAVITRSARAPRPAADRRRD
jgi:precorrin-2 dehydrogenase/sirohydrochlorin ferrochelatase